MKKIFGITLFFFSIFMNGQNNFSGEITYNVQRIFSVNSNQNNKKVDDILEESKSGLGDEKVKLTFNKDESTSNLVKKLDNDGDKWSSFRSSQIDAQGIFYYNENDKILTNQLEAFGETFLVSSEPYKNPWSLKNKTKKIGKYTCYLAERFDEVKGLNKVIKRKYEAWYTPELPMPFGPTNSVGTPGIVLEVTVTGGSIPYKIMVENITISPESKVFVKKPLKGKKVTSKEFEEINQKALEALIGKKK